jgi:hypothetical protein
VKANIRQVKKLQFELKYDGEYDGEYRKGSKQKN